ncbi:site-2 protease family protein [bacterium]|nr:site-2 protease family protein [bacterium]
MSPDIQAALTRLLLFAPPFILSLSFHEFAHAWAANKLGDSTARYLGRMTLDPMSHISVMGTIIFPAIAILFNGPLFGWAKPVPVDSRNFKKPAQHMALVAAAGPASNLILAVICVFALSLLAGTGPDQVLPFSAREGMAGATLQMLDMAVWLNLFLCVFNLLPLPPLDGSRIIQGFVSPRISMKIDAFGSQAQILLLILLFTGLLRYLAIPVYIIRGLLFHVFDVPMA